MIAPRTAADLGAALGSGLWLALCLPLALGGDEIGAAWLEPGALLALVPLLWRLRGASARRALALGWVAGLAHFGLSLFWVERAMTVFGGLPLVAAIPILLLLVSFLALFWALAIWGAVRLRARLGLGLVVGLPVCWTALEFARNHVLTGFPWAAVGHTQVRSLWLAQLASLGGVYLVGYVVVWTNAVLASLLAWRLWKWERPAGRGLLVWAMALLVAAGWGAWRLARPPCSDGERRLVVAVVQGNLDEKAGLRGVAAQRWVLSRMLAESRAAVAAGAALVVWPEGTLPLAVHPDSESLALRGEAFAPLPGATLVVGAIGRGRVGGGIVQTNSAFVTDGALRVQGRYDKGHLVPFGEYVPLGSILPWQWFVPPGVVFFSPGAGHAPLATPAGRLGILICYEAVFPEIARAAAAAGAELLVNITNDSWYGATSAPYQHLAISRLRSIETGLYQVRAANTGLSAIIDPVGRELGRLPVELSDLPRGRLRPADLAPARRLVAEVALRPSDTVYRLVGDAFAWLCLALALAALAASFVPRFRAGLAAGR